MALRSILTGVKSGHVDNAHSADLPVIEQWAEDSTGQALESTGAMGKEDGDALVEIIEIYGTGQLFPKYAKG